MFRNKIIRLFAVQFAILTGCFPAIAQDSLYAAPPPDDAVFVRFIGVDGPNVDWQELRFTTDETSALDDYFVVHASDTTFDRGSMITVFPDESGAFIEVVEPPRSIDKIALGFLNLGDVSASLKTADGKVEIVGSVAPLGLGFRDVNPISISVAVFADGEEVGNVLDLSLRRGQLATVVLSAPGEVRLVESKFVPGVVE